jgi:hypothetical protein
LRDAQQGVAVRAFQETRQVIGHDTRRGQRFAGVGQQGVDVGIEGDQCGGFVRGGGCTQVSRPGSYDTGAPEGALRTATMECRDGKYLTFWTENALRNTTGC